MCMSYVYMTCSTLYEEKIFIQTNTETSISCSPVLCGIDTFCGAIGTSHCDFLFLCVWIQIHVYANWSPSLL